MWNYFWWINLILNIISFISLLKKNKLQGFKFLCSAPSCVIDMLWISPHVFCLLSRLLSGVKASFQAFRALRAGWSFPMRDPGLRAPPATVTAAASATEASAGTGYFLSGGPLWISWPLLGPLSYLPTPAPSQHLPLFVSLSVGLSRLNCKL